MLVIVGSSVPMAAAAFQHGLGPLLLGWMAATEGAADEQASADVGSVVGGQGRSQLAVV